MKDRLAPAIISVLFALLALGLFYTQILRFGYYSQLSRNNSIRIVPIDGPRGDIYDRNKTPMVTSRLSFDAAIVFHELTDRRKLALTLNSVLGMSGEEIAYALNKAAARPYAPVTIAEDIDKNRALSLEEASFDIHGLVVETRSRRNYIYQEIGGHVFGYLSEVTEGELEGLKDYGYQMKDLIGRDGLEKYYDKFLRGVSGGTQVEVDNRGRQTRILGLKEPACGKDLYLTVDSNIQSVCDKLLKGHSGAALVMNPKNGEVLALASSPSYDPNLFVRPGTSRERLRLVTDKSGLPLLNRAISGLYPPGSVFKIVTASAALETRKISPQTRFSCSGSYKLGRGKFDCWKEEGHGSQTIVEGLMNSCNVFFYQTGRAAGVDSIEAYAKLFGFGRPTGLDLPDEAKGIVPGRAWKTLYKKDVWYEGETLNYAIGQGYLAVTPIQVLEMTTVIANKGKAVRPHIVKRIDKSDVAGIKYRTIGLRDDTIRKIRQGLYEVVNNENGTGRRAKIEGVVVAGKTGTAQNPQGRTHAWFTGFAPFDDPRICLVVFLEHGGKGGVNAADIAHGILEEIKARGYL